MKLGVDLDGCLADFNTAYTKLLIEIKGEDLFPPDRNDDNFPTMWFYERAYGYEDVEAEAWRYIKDGGNEFWHNLPSMPTAEGAILMLDLLANMEHDVYFITHRSGNDVKWQSEAWLQDRHMDNPTVLIAGNKAPIIQALELDFYIDDKPETIQELDTMKYPIYLYLKDAPYNRDLVLTRGKRVSTVLKALQELTNGK